MRLIKGKSAHEANKILHRRGAFWQHESYDHLVRSDEELSRTILYVLNNPVKPRLVKEWSEWPWNYLRDDFRA